MSRPKHSKTIGRVNTPAAVAVAREDQASKLYYDGVRTLNAAATCGLPPEERAELLARIAAFAQTRLEQVLGELPIAPEVSSQSRPTGSGLASSKQDLAFLE